MMPFCPSLPICFITRLISMYCLMSRLMSGTVVPEPAAIRRLRDALSSFASLRSRGVIDMMIAS